MAVTSKIYVKMVEVINVSPAGMADYLSATIKTALTTSANGISQTADTSYLSLTNEVTGTGYTAGGATLGSKTLGTASLVTTWDAADVAWTTATFTGAAQAHTYSDSTASKFLMTYQDFGGSATITALDFYIVWHASGLMTLTVA